MVPEERKTVGMLTGSKQELFERDHPVIRQLREIPELIFPDEMEKLPPSALSLKQLFTRKQMEQFDRMTEMLRERGRKNIAFIVDYDTPSNRMKIQGYHVGMEGEGVVGWTDGSQLGGYSATLKLIKEHPETDAIIYSEDNLAVSGLRALYEEGRTVPGDVALVGLNNSAFSELSFLPLSSIDNMLYRQSRMAVKNLELILAGQKVPKHIMIETEFVERRTT